MKYEREWDDGAFRKHRVGTFGILLICIGIRAEGEHKPMCYSNTSIPEAPMPMHQVTAKCVFEIMDYEVRKENGMM